MKLIFLILISLILSGCSVVQTIQDRKAQREEEYQRQKAEQQEQERLDAEAMAHQYDGWTEDKVIMEFGAPSKIENAGSFKIYYYRTDQGVTARSSAGVFYGSSFGTSRAKSHYEEATFFFKNGKVAKYDYQSQ
ncbi:hypothetical protein CCP2SC5_1020015 [Azospirillaceae bacterium]